MARGGHGLPYVTPGPTLPYPSMPCGRTTPETALQPFQRWPAHWMGDLWLSSSPLDTPRRMPIKEGEVKRNEPLPPTHPGERGNWNDRKRKNDENTTSQKCIILASLKFKIVLLAATPGWPICHL
jgi:hypothetical protein